MTDAIPGIGPNEDVLDELLRKIKEVKREDTEVASSFAQAVAAYIVAFLREGKDVQQGLFPDRQSGKSPFFVLDRGIGEDSFDRNVRE